MAVTEDELDRAKSVMLDLLGWGVTPEYLVDPRCLAGCAC